MCFVLRQIKDWVYCFVSFILFHNCMQWRNTIQRAFVISEAVCISKTTLQGKHEQKKLRVIFLENIRKILTTTQYWWQLVFNTASRTEKYFTESMRDMKKPDQCLNRMSFSQLKHTKTHPWKSISFRCACWTTFRRTIGLWDDNNKQYTERDGSNLYYAVLLRHMRKHLQLHDTTHT